MIHKKKDYVDIIDGLTERINELRKLKRSLSKDNERLKLKVAELEQPFGVR